MGVMRIVLAGILGAIAMFIWVTIAHVATPLGATGFSKIPDEAPLIAEMQRTLGDHGGLYSFPWVDPSDKSAMQDYAQKTKQSASGLLLYRGPGVSNDMTRPMLYEFVKELIETLIAAFLLGLAGIGGYLGRAGFVTLIGVSAAITTNASYWIWWGFPGDYTLAYMIITFVGYVVAALTIAAIVKPKPAAA